MFQAPGDALAEPPLRELFELGAFPEPERPKDRAEETRRGRVIYILAHNAGEVLRWNMEDDDGGVYVCGRIGSLPEG